MHLEGKTEEFSLKFKEKSPAFNLETDLICIFHVIFEFTVKSNVLRAFVIWKCCENETRANKASLSYDLSLKKKSFQF